MRFRYVFCYQIINANWMTFSTQHTFYLTKITNLSTVSVPIISNNNNALTNSSRPIEIFQNSMAVFDRNFYCCVTTYYFKLCMSKFDKFFSKKVKFTNFIKTFWNAARVTWIFKILEIDNNYNFSVVWLSIKTEFVGYVFFITYWPTCS